MRARAEEIGAGSLQRRGAVFTKARPLERSAFASALNDVELIADVKKRNFGLQPVSGEEVEALANEVMTQPPEVIQRLRKLLGKQ